MKYDWKNAEILFDTRIQAIGILATGRWQPSKRHSNNSFKDYHKDFKLWFVFCDRFPKKQYFISEVDELELAPDPFVLQKFDNYNLNAYFEHLDYQEFGKKIISASLGINNTDNSIALWRRCRSRDLETHRIPNIINPGDRYHAKLLLFYDIPNGKTVIHEASEESEFDNYFDVYDVFVINKICEYRHSQIDFSGRCSLFSEIGNKKELISKSKFSEDELEKAHL